MEIKPRKLISQLEAEIAKPTKKIIFLWGPRQTGKSTILNYLRQKFGGSYFNFDDLNDQKLFVPELAKLQSSIEQKNNNPQSKLVFIDEIQKSPESTQSLKILADNADYLIIATGSSELRAKTQQFDTLAGRYKEFVLFPLTIDEIALFHDANFKFKESLSFADRNLLNHYLEENMIYGSYPGVILATNKIEEIKNISQNSVVKDIVNIYDLKDADLVYNLLRLLAMQIGNLINITEIASSLKTTKPTIDNYLSILTKNRIIYLLEPYRTNKRRAYLGRKKVFFYDLGIRNSLIDDFRPLNLRPDLGAVFENLVVMGAWRQINYQRNNNKLHYFREISGSRKEIDLIIETPDGKKTGHEIKMNNGKVNEFPELKIEKYDIISQETAPDFLI